MAAIRRATIEDLERLAQLLDAYRQFYQQKSDVEGARNYLRDRLEHQQGVMFIAELDGHAAGFTQLFPTFSSVRMQRCFVLNDLYVDPSARKAGIGRALLEAARAYAESVGAFRLSLITATTTSRRRRSTKARDGRWTINSGLITSSCDAATSLMDRGHHLDNRAHATTRLNVLRRVRLFAILALHVFLEAKANRGVGRDVHAAHEATTAAEDELADILAASSRCYASALNGSGRSRRYWARSTLARLRDEYDVHDHLLDWRSSWDSRTHCRYIV